MSELLRYETALAEAGAELRGNLPRPDHRKPGFPLGSLRVWPRCSVSRQPDNQKGATQ